MVIGAISFWLRDPKGFVLSVFRSMIRLRYEWFSVAESTSFIGPRLIVYTFERTTQQNPAASKQRMVLRGVKLQNAL
jgi:hypothetical protein